MDIAAQLDREHEMAERGRARVQTQVEQAIARGCAVETPAGVALAKRAVKPLSDAITEFMEGAAAKGRAGRRHSAVPLLKGVCPDLAAYITVRVVVSAAVQRVSLKTAAMRVANHLADELMAAEFESKNEALYRSVIRNAANRGLSTSRAALSLNLANRKFEVVEKPWTEQQRLLLGTKLVELAIESMGIIASSLVTIGKSTRKHELSLTPEIETWFREFNGAAAVARPMYLPTVIPPQKWEGTKGSPYYGMSIRHNAILTRSFPGQLDALGQAPMPTVYEGLNAIQETPWRINRRVLEVMQQAWEMDAGLTCLPRREDLEVPESPPEVHADEKGGVIRKAWRMKVRTIHAQNAANRSVRFDFARTLAIAQDYQKEDKIYFPHRLDFRGRCYATSTSLTPQGSDTAKGLLEFANGKPLGDNGHWWLGIHGSNLFGNDKVSLDDRYEWAVENMDKAWAVAEDPLGNLWWTEADKPWCFLAWCFEWADYSRRDAKESEHFVSRLPIALDGSCNGIQHFSAMLRDPVGGAAVNLVPAEKPQDIYQRVADVTVEKLKAEADPSKQWMAAAWVEFGITRKITKRAVMVLPYGGTFKSCMDYVRDAVREKIQDGTVNPFGDEMPKAAAYLAAAVWSAIGEVVIAAREAMSWLQACARVATKAGKALRWTTPSGFTCFQDYRDVSERRIETRFLGSVLKYTSIEQSDRLDISKQASAVAPNFVHSLDASAMMLTIVKCRAAGVHNFAMIHDSYGTHAADTDTLANLLREAFVEMYEAEDVLAKFREEVANLLTPEEAEELPPVPVKGSLDLRAVLGSPYFFA